MEQERTERTERRKDLDRRFCVRSAALDGLTICVRSRRARSVAPYLGVCYQHVNGGSTHDVAGRRTKFGSAFLITRGACWFEDDCGALGGALRTASPCLLVIQGCDL